MCYVLDFQTSNLRRIDFRKADEGQPGGGVLASLVYGIRVITFRNTPWVAGPFENTPTPSPGKFYLEVPE